MKLNQLKGKFSLCLISLLLLAGTLQSCGGNDEESNPPLDPQEEANRKVNGFVVEAMKKLYLWNKEIPSTVSATSTEDPKTLFEKVCRRYNVTSDKWIDRWSSLEDEGASTRVDEEESLTTGFGYGLCLYKQQNGRIFALVTYVTPDSPAAKAGIKRGDVIYKMNGQYITEANYADLYYGNYFKAGMAYIQKNNQNQDGIDVIATGKEHNLQAVTKYFDPIVLSKVIETGGKKTGYFCYTRFTDIASTVSGNDKQLTEGAKERRKQLDAVFQNFKEKQVTDIILDLRYNPGGYAETSRYLASMLAPSSLLNGSSLFLKNIWNAEFNKSLSEAQRTQFFNKDVAVNLNLNRVYILTTSGTASASEATLIGLRPYMDVFHIGETTHGKYCGAISVDAEYFYHSLLGNKKKDIEDIKDWEIEMMIFKFANKKGYTDFTGGIPPTHQVAELRNYWLEPLGNESDPMIAKALEMITGNANTRIAIPETIPGNVEKLPNPERGSGMLMQNFMVE